MSDIELLREALTFNHDISTEGKPYCFTCHGYVEPGCSQAEELAALERIVEALSHRCCGCPHRKDVL